MTPTENRFGERGLTTEAVEILAPAPARMDASHCEPARPQSWCANRDTKATGCLLPPTQWYGLFCTPAEVPGVVVTHGQDVDYTMTVETVNTPDGKASVMDGLGPSWSWGIPTSVDARGKTAWGTYWRYSGVFGGSKSHRVFDHGDSSR